MPNIEKLNSNISENGGEQEVNGDLSGTDFRIERFSKEAPTSNLQSVREELGTSDSENVTELPVYFPEVGAKREIEINYGESPESSGPSLGQRAANRIKRLLAYVGIVGGGIGAVEGVARGEETNKSDENVSTNMVSAVPSPKTPQIFTSTEKNWGPGTNKVGWTKVPGANVGKTAEDSKAGPEKPGQQKTEQKGKVPDRSYRGRSYGSSSYGVGHNGVGFEQGKYFNGPIVEDQGNGWVRAQGGIFVRSDRKVFPPNYNPSKTDLNQAAKRGLMWSSSDHTFIKNPFK